MTKKLYFIACFAAICTILLSGCSKTKTYAEMKAEENAAIKEFMKDKKVITEDQFEKQGEMTGENEWVLLASSGVYMHIERKGGKNGNEEVPGRFEKIKDKAEGVEILCRFTEWNLFYYPMVMLTNNVPYYASIPEVMTVSYSSGTFQGTFSAESSLMYQTYYSQAVPAGWLFPLKYINLGRQVEEDEDIAKVLVVVPHTQGSYQASSNVYPCQYEITYQLGN